MTKRMLVDATHPEETRVALVSGNWLIDFDFERASKKQLKGNIYLAKVIRIEPSLQAAFVEYGGNRHGFLPFAEIHPDYYRIPMADRPAEEETDAGDDELLDDDVHQLDPTLPPDDELDHDHPLLGEHQESELNHEGGSVSDASVEGELPQIEQAGSFNEPQPSSEFSSVIDQDLGLITDFGNAAIGEQGIPPVAAPLETVGGEAADAVIHEERRNFPPRHRYKIQEVIKRRQVMLIQVVKEERGNKGAALTTFLSLAGRYCVLMPNTEHGGGVSRKITSHQDRRRMKEILDQLEVPTGMAIILRTAGMEQAPPEIQRDLEYLLRIWNGIREQTLLSSAPALIYEEANLIKRSMRDLYAQDVSDILVSGTQGFELARDFMRTIMPDQVEKIRLYEETVPLFFKFNVEKQIDNLYNPVVQLRSGGYIVINPTEALVSIDVNSGKATRERHIEGTALKTNLEAAEEIARQLRLRDLAGLVVIDFIDMEDGRNNAAVERRMKEAMRIDRARLQIGRISPFGLLELSRQRLRPSLMEINFEKCQHCAGVGFVRSVDSAALSILRMIEEEGIKLGSAEIVLHVPTKIALFILNQKRSALTDIERRYSLQVLLHSDDALVAPDFRLERTRGGTTTEQKSPAVDSDQLRTDAARDYVAPPPMEGETTTADAEGEGRPGSPQGRDNGKRNGRGRFGYGRNRNNRQENRPPRDGQPGQPGQPEFEARPPQTEPEGNVAERPINEADDPEGNVEPGFEQNPANPSAQDPQRRGRRRGRRGGRGRRPNGERPAGERAVGERAAGEQGDRPPQEGGFRPRQNSRNDNRGRGDWGNNNFERNSAAPFDASPSAILPPTIHEIDTTPREPSSAPPEHVSHSRQPEAPKAAVATVRQSPIATPRASISSAPYEVVDQPQDKPKGGWWKKLTGQ